MGLWYPKDMSFELTAFLDSDHAAISIHRKSTSGGNTISGVDKRLVSWSSKKQDHFNVFSRKPSDDPTALSWGICQGDSLNLLITGLDDGVAASFQRSRIHKPHAHTQAFKARHSVSSSSSHHQDTSSHQHDDDDDDDDVETSRASTPSLPLS
ncbi:hypothetical protein Tco_0059140 [Tanacetum coccineum]